MKLGQDTAFPLDGEHAYSAIENNNTGMSKRFYAACAAMQGLLANNDYVSKKQSGYSGSLENQEIVKDSYQIAGELLKQENDE